MCDWLVRVKQSLYATTLLITRAARILTGAFCACNLDGHIELGLFGQWTPLCVRLLAEPAFCALCGMSHGDQHKTARPHAVKALISQTRGFK